jgi:hypothetical protein
VIASSQKERSIAGTGNSIIAKSMKTTNMPLSKLIKGHNSGTIKE